MSKLTLNLFGKKGCKKCEVMKSRLDRIISEENIADKIEFNYFDLLQENALVEFCMRGCLNPSKIPVIVAEYNGRRLSPSFISVHSLKPILGLQTVYDEGGVITSEMLKELIFTGFSQCGISAKEEHEDLRPDTEVSSSS